MVTVSRLQPRLGGAGKEQRPCESLPSVQVIWRRDWPRQPGGLVLEASGGGERSAACRERRCRPERGVLRHARTRAESGALSRSHGRVSECGGVSYGTRGLRVGWVATRRSRKTPERTDRSASVAGAG